MTSLTVGEAQEVEVAEPQEVDNDYYKPQLELDGLFAEALEQAKQNLDVAKADLEDAEAALRVAREALSVSKRQLQNAYLANGLNSDGTERKPRGKKNNG